MLQLFRFINIYMDIYITSDVVMHIERYWMTWLCIQRYITDCFNVQFPMNHYKYTKSINIKPVLLLHSNFFEVTENKKIIDTTAS